MNNFFSRIFDKKDRGNFPRRKGIAGSFVSELPQREVPVELAPAQAGRGCHPLGLDLECHPRLRRPGTYVI